MMTRHLSSKPLVDTHLNSMKKLSVRITLSMDVFNAAFLTWTVPSKIGVMLQNTGLIYIPLHIIQIWINIPSNPGMMNLEMPKTSTYLVVTCLSLIMARRRAMIVPKLASFMYMPTSELSFVG
jgi:hypothetical protein